MHRASSVGGSWAAQYEGLKITTRRTHCGLPGWPVPHEGFCERGDGEMLAPEFLRRVNASSFFTLSGVLMRNLVMMYPQIFSGICSRHAGVFALIRNLFMMYHQNVFGAYNRRM